MNPVCAKSSSQPGIVLDQQRAIGSHGGAKQWRHDCFRIGLRAGRETNERAGERRGVENLGENLGEGVGVSGR